MSCEKSFYEQRKSYRSERISPISGNPWRLPDARAGQERSGTV